MTYHFRHLKPFKLNNISDQTEPGYTFPCSIISIQVDPDEVDEILEELMCQLESLEDQGLEPAYVVIGEDYYGMLFASHYLGLQRALVPERFMDLPVVVIPGDALYVVPSPIEMLLYKPFDEEDNEYDL